MCRILPARGASGQSCRYRLIAPSLNHCQSQFFSRRFGDVLRAAMRSERRIGNRPATRGFRLGLSITSLPAEGLLSRDSDSTDTLLKNLFLQAAQKDGDTNAGE